MSKEDRDIAVLKCIDKTPLTTNEVLEMIDVEAKTLLDEYGLDHGQLEQVLSFRKQEVARWSMQLMGAHGTPKSNDLLESVIKEYVSGK